MARDYKPRDLGVTSALFPELGLSDSAYDGGLGLSVAPPAPVSPIPAAIAPPPIPTPVAAQQPVAAPPPPAAAVTSPTPAPAAPAAPPEPPPPIGGVQPTIDTANPDQEAISHQLDRAEQQYGLRIAQDWRTRLANDPEGFLAYVRDIRDNASKGMDTHNRQWWADWYTAIENATRRRGSAPNPKYEIAKQNEELFNTGQQRLAESAAYGSRGAEQELIARLASLGLLDSGIAARELTRLREGQQFNYGQAIQQLNELITRGNLDLATQDYLTRLVSDLSLRNQTLGNRQQEDILRQRQGNPTVDIIASIIPAVIAALSPRKPTVSPYGSGYGQTSLPGTPISGPLLPDEQRPVFLGP